MTISTKEKLPQYLSASDGALRAETVGEMEKFRVVQCADDSFAIRSERTGEYLSAREEKDSDGETGIQFCFDREFIESTQEKFRIISLQADTEPLNGDNYDGHYRVGTAVPCHIQSVLNNEWLACDSGGFLTTVMDLADAGEFFVSVKSHNNDSQEELDILHNSGWLNLDHSGVGYWNVQSELGSGSVASLKKLGYQPMVANANRKAAKQPAEEQPAAVSAPAAIPAPGSAGEIRLHNVPDRTAAMLMAIVADKLGKPLNELRFISIREIEQ